MYTHYPLYILIVYPLHSHAEQLHTLPTLSSTTGAKGLLAVGDISHSLYFFNFIACNSILFCTKCGYSHLFRGRHPVGE